MKHFFILSCIFISSLCASCITRAPSNYELDRRAGRVPGNLSVSVHKQFANEIHEIKGQETQSIEPKRVEPRIEKVWIYNQELNDGAYLQGTFVFMQIDNGYWLNPADQKQ